MSWICYIIKEGSKPCKLIKLSLTF